MGILFIIATLCAAPEIHITTLGITPIKQTSTIAVSKSLPC